MVILTFEIWSPKNICTISGVCLKSVPKMKLIRPLVSEELGHKHTHRQTEKQRNYRYYSIDSNIKVTYTAKSIY